MSKQQREKCMLRAGHTEGHRAKESTQMWAAEASTYLHTRLKIQAICLKSTGEDKDSQPAAIEPHSSEAGLEGDKVGLLDPFDWV
jgi:hypothetical protein